MSRINTPIRSGIAIKWCGTEEFIPIPWESLDQLHRIDQTLEWWPQPRYRKFVQYHVENQTTRQADGTFKIILTYKPELNSHLPRDEVSWGSSTIIIMANQQSGNAYWRDDNDDSDDGNCSWSRISRPLIEEKKRQSVSRIERQQKVFRDALFACEEAPQCALTGEQLDPVLEAAHIISACHGGSEVIENGILLRADIHRLYDAGYFKISPTGDVIVVKNVSPEYMTLLHGKRISKLIVDRIQDALHEVLNQGW